jgi:GTP-binding protein YchF
MKIGLFGKKYSGKTIIFTSSGGSASGGTGSFLDAVNSSVPVRDTRIDHLTGIFNPKKTVYAKIEMSDIPGYDSSLDDKALNRIAGFLRECDIICFVLNLFDTDSLITGENPDPIRDYNILSSELIIRDMITVENKLERMAKTKKTNESEIEKALFERIKDTLEKEIPLSEAGLDDQEIQIISGYGLLTLKKQMAVINISEDLIEEKDRIMNEFNEELPLSQPPIVICGTLEAEIATLPPEEQQEFAVEMGIPEPGRDQLARTAYEVMDKISFFTVGEDEVRAWTITRGCKAKEAAGSIHSDLERGFIKGNIVPFELFKDCASEKEAIEKKLYRLEGASYEMQDGDIMEVRFNV